MEATESPLHNQSNQTNKGETTREKVKNTLTEELFFGICAPIGSLKPNVIKSIEKIIHNKFNYEVEVIKLSKYIEEYKINEYKALDEKTPAYSNLVYKIQEGNEIRKKYNNNSILVELSIKDILYSRTEHLPETEALNHENIKSRRKCYIFDSIKNKEELLLLRRIYTKNFYLFSVFSPIEERKKRLSDYDMAPTEIDEIIEKDEFENNDFGQNVRGTFTLGDFILRVSKDNKIDLDTRIERFLHLIFESDIITPTDEEKAMYSAKSAAGNSACLSRQVGAAIISEKGDLISNGWNDVPKFGGNLYSEGDIDDNRCKVKGYCSNDSHKYDLVDNLLKSLKNDEKTKLIFNNKEGFYDIKIFEDLKRNLRDSAIKNLIEFSRSVHAEMHAIITGSQMTGSKMINGKLFCTTYPCHNCARHIIVAGIKEVYYIEPYKKSLCLDLHSDAITEDENCKDKVRILVFDGVAPRNYLTFFTKFASRKDKGKRIKIDFKKVKPKKAKSIQSLPTLEQQAIHSLNECGILEKNE